jgi:hypothetical protein
MDRSQMTVTKPLSTNANKDVDQQRQLFAKQ